MANKNNERKSISKKLRFEVFKRDNFTCQYCGRMSPDVVLEIDHINPIANKGDNNILNLITSCKDCNRGKGKSLLSENQEIKKQQEQLKDLSAKKEQLEMLIEWKKELETFKDQQVKEIEGFFGNCIFTDTGKNKIKKFIDIYGFEEVYESTKLSVEQYYNKENNETAAMAFDKIGGILYNRKQQKEIPSMHMINKICYYAKRNYYYFDVTKFKKFLLINNFDDNNLLIIESMVKDSRNWSELKENIYDVFEVEL